jgi:3-phenylpropionate/trans-cinnamate dioxygenase ferredoxin subunit
MPMPTPPMPIPLIELAALPEGRGRRVCKDGHDLALFRIGDEVYAIDDGCPHAGASLGNARRDGTRITCPAHGLKFDLVRPPAAAGGTAALDVRRHPVHVVDGIVLLGAAAAGADGAGDVAASNT